VDAQRLFDVPHVGFETGDINVEVVFDTVKPCVDGPHGRFEIAGNETLELVSKFANFFMNLFLHSLAHEFTLGLEPGVEARVLMRVHNVH
jgi:hypothetical protein